MFNHRNVLHWLFQSDPSVQILLNIVILIHEKTQAIKEVQLSKSK